MKNFLVFTVIAFAVYFQPESTSAQMRPVKKPVATATPTAPAAKPVAKAASPAEEFFNQGLKCDAKDYDCQVSNYTKAINLQLNTKAVFQKRAAAYMGREDFEKAIGDLTKVIELDLNDATGFKDRGKAYLGMPKSYQNTQNAIKDFTNAIDLEPKDVEAYKLRGTAYQSIGNSEKAAADLNKLVALAPDSSDALIGQAQLLLSQRQYAKAEETFAKVIAANPNSSEAYLGRGASYLGQRKSDSALADFTKAIQLDTKNGPAYRKRAEVFEKLGKRDEALADFTKAIDLDPNSSSLFFRRGMILRDLGNYDEALSNFSNAIKLNPIFAQAYEARGITYESLKRLSEARTDYDKAISLDDSLADAYVRRAQLKALIANDPNWLADRVRGFENAVKKASAQVQADDSDADAYIKLGIAKVYLQFAQPQPEGFKSAVVDLEKAISINPNSIEANYWLDHVYGLYLKDWNKAETAFQRLYRLRKIPGTSDRDKMYINSAGNWMYSTTPDEYLPNVLELSNKTIADYPDIGSSYFIRGMIFERLKQHEKAIADLSRAIELDPSDVNAAMYLADAYYSANNDLRGMAVMNDLVARKPESYYSYILRGGYYYRSKRYSQALADYQVALEKATDPDEKSTAQNSINSVRGQVSDEDDRARRKEEQDQRKKANREANVNAILGAVSTIVEGATQPKSSPSSQTSNPTRQPTPQSTTNSPAGNRSATGELSNGRGTSSRAHIYDITADNNLDDKCSGGNAENPEAHCWGPWEQVAPQVQIRAKGPMAWKGTLGDPNKTVYYEWAFQAKNLTNSPVCMKAEFTHGDGKKGNLMPCMVPGGTSEFRGGEALTTSYPTQTLSVRSYDFELCSNFKKNSERSYTCIAWPDEVQK